MTVTVTFLSSNTLEYDVNNFDDLINELNKIGELFCLTYGDTKVFHSLEDNNNNHELKDTYSIAYLDYDKDLIFRIKEMKNMGNTFIRNVLNDISTLFKQRELYDNSIFLVFLASNLPIDTDSQCFSLISDKLKNIK